MDTRTLASLNIAVDQHWSGGAITGTLLRHEEALRQSELTAELVRSRARVVRQRRIAVWRGWSAWLSARLRYREV